MRIPSVLLAKPEDVAAAILRAERGSADVVYVYRIWAVIMAAICLLPERVFKRLRL
jgi:hypothetical protein